MSLSLSKVIQTLQASLMGTREKFTQENTSAEIDLYKQMIVNGLGMMRSLSPMTLSHVITLKAGELTYQGPDDIWQFKEHTWGKMQCAPWEPGYVTSLPSVTVNNGQLLFSFAPTQSMINSLGSQFQYFYLGNYVIAEDPALSNVGTMMEPLVILLAMASAMEMLMVRGVSSPVQVKPGTGMVKRSAPAEVHDILMAQARRLAPSL